METDGLVSRRCQSASLIISTLVLSVGIAPPGDTYASVIFEILMYGLSRIWIILYFNYSVEIFCAELYFYHDVFYFRM